MNKEYSPITDEDLEEILRLASGSVAGPWKSYIEGRDHYAGDDFIMTGGPDMYVGLYGYKASWRPTMDFIAATKQMVPRLVNEIYRLRAELQNKDLQNEF